MAFYWVIGLSRITTNHSKNRVDWIHKSTIGIEFSSYYHTSNLFNQRNYLPIDLRCANRRSYFSRLFMGIFRTTRLGREKSFLESINTFLPFALFKSFLSDYLFYFCPIISSTSKYSY